MCETVKGVVALACFWVSLIKAINVAGVAFGQQTVGQWVGVGQRMTTVTRCGQVKQTQRKFGANGHVLHLLE
jgi:hypothetical protein